jgi:spore maturation protein CgeB
MIRVLVIDGTYHLYKEILNTLPKLGCEVYRVCVVKNQSAESWINKLTKAIDYFKPDFIITVNQFGFDANGEVGELLEKLQIPVAVWYVDSPLFILKDSSFPAPNMSQLFLWERSYEKIMRSKGAKHIHYLPLATDPDKFAQTEKLPIDKEVVFVGDSLTKAINKVERVLNNEQIELANLISIDLIDGKKFNEFFENVEQLPQENIWKVLELAVWQATATKRLDMLLSVVNEYDLHIYGDTAWKELVPNATYRGPVNYGNDLSKVYATSKVVLNTTSCQMPTAVNQRVFDVPMSGGFVLSDKQPDMSELFDEFDVAWYTNTSYLLEEITIALRSEGYRQYIINTCRERILEEHTYLHRLKKILSVMNF